MTQWPLADDIEYAAQMVRKGFASNQQAASSCGITLADLEARLGGRVTGKRNMEQAQRQSLHGSADRDVKCGEASVEGAIAKPVDVEQLSTDFFVFYRDSGEWVWQRVDKANKIVKTSQNRFAYYLDCVADARPHGFTGRPLFLFAQADLMMLKGSEAQVSADAKSSALARVQDSRSPFKA